MDRQTMWVIYFANLVAMERHPGYMREGLQPLSLKQLADLTDAMVRETEKRIQCPQFGPLA